jgi:putative adhesin
MLTRSRHHQITRFPLGLAAMALAFSTVTYAQPRDAGDPQQPIQARPGGPDTGPGSEKTVDVAKGTRLVLSNQAGEVVVRSWDQDRVRIQANHGTREQISAETTDNTLRIRTMRTGGSRGPGGLVDYQITVPRWMPVNLTGTYLDATIEGTAAEVTVETVHGNAKVTGGNGNVSLRSVEGVITVDKANGRVQATTVNEGIRITNSQGEITAETTNGDIFIDSATTSALEAYTVNGEVTFNGTIRDNGVYKLGTHNGDIRVGLGGATNATIFVRTFQGDFTADFPVQLPEGQNARSGSKRFNFTLGSGSARIELQSFGGDIVLARKAIVSRSEERRRRREGVPPPAQPPQPPQPGQPSPTPAPKPPKPPGFDGSWDVDLGRFDSAQFEADMQEWGEHFAKDFEFHFDEQQFEQRFDTVIAPKIQTNVEKILEGVFKKGRQ